MTRLLENLLQVALEVIKVVDVILVVRIVRCDFEELAVINTASNTDRDCSHSLRLKFKTQ